MIFGPAPSAQLLAISDITWTVEVIAMPACRIRSSAILSAILVAEPDASATTWIS